MGGRRTARARVLALAATVVLAATTGAAATLGRAPTARAEQFDPVRLAITASGDWSGFLDAQPRLFPVVPTAASNAESRDLRGGCRVVEASVFYAVVGGRITRQTVFPDVQRPDCTPTYRRATWTGSGGWGGMRQLVWAPPAVYGPTDRLYGLDTAGVLHRYSVGHAAEGTPVVRSLGSVAGFASARSMALVHADGARDIILVNLRGGSLYQVTVPAGSPMRAEVVAVRSAGWGGVDQLVTVPTGDATTHLGAVDRRTGALTAYALGRVRGAATVIGSGHREATAHPGVVVQGGGTYTDTPYRGAGRLPSDGLTADLPTATGVVVVPGGWLRTRVLDPSLPLSRTPSALSNAVVRTGSACYDPTFVSLFAVVADEVLPLGIGTAPGGECNPGGVDAGYSRGVGGFAGSRQLAWARAAQPGAAQRLYVLGATGVLSRWEPSTATGALTLRAMGSVGGFGAVRSMALVSSDNRRDVILVNLTGGSLYEVTVPATARMGVRTAVVRRTGWGDVEQLTATPLSGGGSTLAAFDRPTGVTLGYRVGAPAGAATSITLLGRDGVALPGALVAGWEQGPSTATG